MIFFFVSLYRQIVKQSARLLQTSYNAEELCWSMAIFSFWFWIFHLYTGSLILHTLQGRKKFRLSIYLIPSLFHLFLFLASLLLVCNHEHDLLWFSSWWIIIYLVIPLESHLDASLLFLLSRRQLNLIHLNFQRTIQPVLSALHRLTLSLLRPLSFLTEWFASSPNLGSLPAILTSPSLWDSQIPIKIANVWSCSTKIFL